MNQFLATLYETQTRIQRYHWNVVGRFEPLHSLFGELYGEIIKDVDEVAEAIRAHNEEVEAGLAIFQKQSVISKPFQLQDMAMIKDLADSYDTIIELAKELTETAEEEHEYGDVDLLGNLIRRYQKNVWKLTSFR